MIYFFHNLYLDARNALDDTYEFSREMFSALALPSRAPYLKPLRLITLALGTVGMTAAVAHAFFGSSQDMTRRLAAASLVPLLGGLAGIPIFVYLSGLCIPLIVSSIVRISLSILF